ncbi:hypothetical protein B7C62_12905 [Kitasatospora albolonga]|uniref:DUF397 domain-containing protein n=1 Tax=Kitasatospora albolonga TaxID=68173 RepID=A0ABC8BTP9_9ACTN|nr:hypothetical protein B7C62_12905 [Kitasatospora albolonga]
MSTFSPASHNAPVDWFTSSYSGANSNCVEAGYLGVAIAVRDTKDREAGTQFFGPAAWGPFVTAVKNYDLT